jgi:hypothetical protein
VTSPGGASASGPPTDLVTALLAAVDAENAAVYGYGVAGARLAAADRSVARGYYDVHRAQAAAVEGWVAQRGASASPPALAYDLPTPAADAVAARAILASLEELTAARYADVVALAASTLQRAAALALQAAAVREAHWRSASVPFPGLVGRLPG